MGKSLKRCHWQISGLKRGGPLNQKAELQSVLSVEEAGIRDKLALEEGKTGKGSI